MNQNRSRCFLLLILTLVLAGCTPTPDTSVPVTELLQDSTQAPRILLDEKPFVTDPAPMMIDGRLYLPFSESLALLGIPAQSYPKADVLTAYHDNCFLSIKTDTLTIRRNGKTLSKINAPLLVKGSLFVPATVIFDSFDLQVTYPKDGVIAIVHQDSQDNPQLVDGEYYIPIAVKEFDLQFYVPKSWSRLPGSPYRFGEQSDFDNYQITFSTHPLARMDDNELIAELTQVAEKNAGVRLYRDQTAPLQVNGLEGLAATYHYDRNNTAGKMLLYVFKRDENAYVFQGWVDAAIDEQTVTEQITDIARSLRFGDMAVDVQREHYIEAPAFFDNGVVLTSALYSNMEVRGQLQLSGTLSDRSVRHLYVAVTRGGETLTQEIPIKDRAFSGIIHTPFGLGKHDLTIYASNNELKLQDRILQASVINVLLQETRWMIPGPLVDSDNDYITSQSSLLTYKTYGDYAKGKQLFLWMVETIRLKPGSDNPAAASAVYLKSSGTEEEVAILYAALLRATEIPARVVAAGGDSPRTWVEMQMNGEWVASDPAAGILRMADGAPPAEAADAHYNMSLSYFQEKYPVIETQPW